jgi:sugar lactone lactonase YvrE
MRVLKTTVLAEGFFFLESPRWHASTLWMSDTVGRKVYRVDLDGKVRIVAQLPDQPFGLGFLSNGTLLVASIFDRRLLRLEDNRLVRHVDLSQLTTGQLNDMVVDHHGRAYVGSFDFKAEAPHCFETACVTLVTPEGHARVVADNLARPTGIVVTGDRQLLVAETFGHRLTAFQITDDGSLIQRRVFANFEQMSPDGYVPMRKGRCGLRPPGSRCLFACCKEAASLTESMSLAAGRWHANLAAPTAELSSA